MCCLQLWKFPLWTLSCFCLNVLLYVFLAARNRPICKIADDIYLMYCNLGARCRWVENFTPRPLYPRERTPVAPPYRRLGGPHSRSRSKSDFTKGKPNKSCDTILWHVGINWQWNYVRYSIVEVLRYQLEGRRFDFRLVFGFFIIELILPAVYVSNIN